MIATDVWTLHGGSIVVETPRQVLGEVTTTTVTDKSGFWSKECHTDDSLEASLEVRGVSIRRGPRHVFDRLSFWVPQKEICVLARPNGWGKSTLLDAIAGLIPVRRGRILILGKDISRMTTWHRARFGLSYLRSIRNVIPRLTVREHLLLRRATTTIASCYPEWRALMPSDNRRADTLSGGEKQRLAIGCLPIRRLLLLDEPFLNLDNEASQMLKDILERIGVPSVVAVPSRSALPRDAQSDPNPIEDHT